MCRVLGDLLEKGVVAKLADDLYCGGNTIDEILCNWRQVLQALSHAGLRLSATKTVICPQQSVILGWIWSNGTLHASPHRIATLSSCAPPKKVGGMRSFLGAYKVLARVIRHCSGFLGPLDDAIGGRPSSEELVWSDSLLSAFHTAQKALSSASVITLPRPDDQLWIVTDGSVKKHSIGATLFVTRNDKIHLAGFFSAKLRSRQPTWLPCEVEALSISSSTKHFSPYIVQSSHKSCILTDSKPCVQAFEKLCRGEFSASPRVSTFLSTVSRFQASVRHLAGSANTPSDFASRNAPPCAEPTCQICSFVKREEDSTVLRVSVQEVLSGNAKLPFTSKAAWFDIQQESADLRRTHAHLVQGTRPSKKATSIKDVKRYLQVASIARDGLLIVRRNQPLTPTRECIIVPREVLNGLLTALHLQLGHPTRHQLSSVFQRYFFALDTDKTIELVNSACHQCASLCHMPKFAVEQSTSDPPEAVGVSFAADVLKRNKQLVLVLRETATSYTATCLIENEQHGTLRDALISLCVGLRPLQGPPAVIRTDPAPGFVRLTNDKLLAQHHMIIEIGRVKNKNKNPVAEKAIRELEDEILRQDSPGEPVSPLKLSIATAALNARMRSRGLSAREMLFQRDQFTNEQVPFVDGQMIQAQHDLRKTNHPHSTYSKAPRALPTPSVQLEVGDLVYLNSDRNKTHARDRYLVTTVDGTWCNIRKFIGSQLRSTSYRVKMSECFKVPGHPETQALAYRRPSSADLPEDEVVCHEKPPDPPFIPPELSTPADQDLLPPHDNHGSVSPATATDPPSCDVDQSPSLELIRTSPQYGLSNPGDKYQDTPITSSADPEINPPLLTQRQSSRQRKTPGYLKDFVLDA